MPNRSLACLAVVILGTTAAGMAQAQIWGTDSLESFPDCPQCSGNAATVGDGIVFDEMHITEDPKNNQTNRGDVRVTGAKLCYAGNGPAGTCSKILPVALSVDKDQLRATATATVAPHKPGDDVTAEMPTRLLIDLLHEKGGATYQLLLRKVNPTHFWVQSNGTTNRYDFVYRMSSVPKHPPYEYNGKVEATFVNQRRLCTQDHPETETQPYAAFIYQGERINSDTKTVRAADKPEDAGWFNLACAGTAMAKLHYLRHTKAALPAGEALTTPGERQAFFSENQAVLKLLTADYCGDGISFTENGQELLYTDLHRFKTTGFPELNKLGSAGAVEAVWGPEGALCLNQPRLYQRDYVELACQRKFPTCPTFLDDWTELKFKLINGRIVKVRETAPGKPVPWPRAPVAVSANP